MHIVLEAFLLCCVELYLLTSIRGLERLWCLVQMSCLPQVLQVCREAKRNIQSFRAIFSAVTSRSAFVPFSHLSWLDFQVAVCCAPT